MVIGLVLFVMNANALSAIADFEINTENVKKHIKILASDEFGGRAPLTEGDTLTTEYLTEQYKELGLVPGWGDNYLQPVPLTKIIPLQTKFKVGKISLVQSDEYVARSTLRISNIQLCHSELVFVGYGINAPEYEWNDYEGINVSGKTVVMLVNDPGFATQDPDFFEGNAMTYYGRWMYKYQEAARQGAAAALMIHETEPAGYPWDVVQNSFGTSQIVLDDAAIDALQVEGWLRIDSAQRLFEYAGLDFQDLKMKAQKHGFQAVPMGLEAQLKVKSKVEPTQYSNNVLAMLPGEGNSNEAVMISAHWDHVGTIETEQGKEILPPLQNLWVLGGSGNPPS